MIGQSAPIDPTAGFASGLADLRRRLELLERLASASSPAAARVNALAYTLADNTPTAVPFTAETFDPMDWHSTSVNTSRITVTIPGLYLVGGIVEFAAFGSGARTASVSVNGGASFAAPMQESDSAGTIDPTLNGSDIVQLVAGDYVELLVFQNSGGAMFINAALWLTRL